MRVVKSPFETNKLVSSAKSKGNVVLEIIKVLIRIFEGHHVAPTVQIHAS